MERVKEKMFLLKENSKDDGDEISAKEINGFFNKNRISNADSIDGLCLLIMLSLRIGNSGLTTIQQI